MLFVEDVDVKSNLMQQFLVMRLFFSFSLMVVSTKSWSLPISAPGQFMLDLNHCGASMNTIWMCTCLFGACQVAVLDGLWCLQQVGQCELAASGKLKKSLSLVTQYQIKLLFFTSLGRRLEDGR
ncbi:hypothetical protein DPMN_108847 [Dreissena polymorpha]|uniref:Uncharacterized protein n=1 Tax=Dreissena polymorpha TaxID=45954 RepID=A0A9D4K9Z3_DREPO|nr:hypothetical protein DPMN_108847 [Dreissena polymorpha]